MNYCPDPAQLSLWDTWVYIHDDREVHLFFLANKPNEAWGGAGHVVSRDWLHWEALPPIVLSGESGAWDAGGCGTGMVFQYDDGRYYMTYTGGLGRDECHGLMRSDDLVAWQKVTRDAPIWPRSDGSFYEEKRSMAAGSSAWRDAFVTRNPQGQWEAVCSARVQEGPPAGRGCLARCRIEAIDRWVTLPPIAAVGRYMSMEVPEIFEFAGRCWVLFSTGSGWGVRIHTPERAIVVGSFYLCADRWEGPYAVPDNNMLIGVSHGHVQAPIQAYVARTVEFHGERLVYHHLAGESPAAFGLPKRLMAEGERLFLAPWDGVRKLWMRELRPSGWKADTTGSVAPGTWSVEGNRVSGRSEYGAVIALAETDAADVDMESTVTIKRGESAGIVVGLSEDRSICGTACLLDAVRGEITICHCVYWHHACGPNLSNVIDCVKRPVALNRSYRLRLIRRFRFAELYVDGRLVFSVATVSKKAGGRMGFLVENAEAEFTLDRLHAIEPLR